MAPILDINTPRGQESLAQETRAVALFEAAYPRLKYIHTDKTTDAKADALLILDNHQLAGLVLTSCRRECSIETFEHWNWEWIITWRKLARGAVLSKHLVAKLYGFIYLVDHDTLLIKRLYDPQRDKRQRWLTPFRIAKTETQATINGGRAIRHNAYVKIDGAAQIRWNATP